MLGWIWKAVRWIFSFGGGRGGRRNRNRSHRDIFTFWDGEQFRALDPLKAWRELDAHPTFRMDVHPAALDAGDAEAWAATVQAVRDVFGVKVLSENAGLTEEECILLLHSFAQWMSALKKNINLPRTSRESTEPKSCDGTGASPAGAAEVPSPSLDLEAEFEALKASLSPDVKAAMVRQSQADMERLMRCSPAARKAMEGVGFSGQENPTAMPMATPAATPATPTKPLSAFGSTSTGPKPAAPSPSSVPFLQRSLNP